MKNKEINNLVDIITNRLKNELPAYYEYHSVEHTLRVLEKVESIAHHQNIGSKTILGD